MSTSSQENDVLSNATFLSGKDTNQLSFVHNKALYTTPPDNIESVLPTLDPQGTQFSKIPATDCILVALAFERLHLAKCGGSPPGIPYRCHPVTEAGVAYMDMRDVLHGRGKDVIPGDRGSAWFKLMTPLHYIVEEYKDHQHESGQPQQFLFAFGRSKLVKANELAYRLYRLFAALRKMNRLKDEIGKGTFRKLIFITFNSVPVEDTLSRLGLEWLRESYVQTWDLQRDSRLQSRFKNLPMSFEYVLESLGIRFEDTRFGNLSRCAGNTAVFVAQVFLALFYRDEDQKDAFIACKPMCWLRYTWVGHALDQTNMAPGELPKRRDENQMNRNDVPQRRNEKVFS
ncbi:Ff.00g061240.m01.CDS01 [Fusarium sp. VM40]|nr:Ff.00g061240.m01.CDS01 [Fusarium sp. VM40]